MFGFFFVSFFPELEPLWAWSLKVPTIVKVELCFSPHASLPFFFFWFGWLLFWVWFCGVLVLFFFLQKPKSVKCLLPPSIIVCETCLKQVGGGG